jgi:putative hydrolase of the HAD superfamily
VNLKNGGKKMKPVNKDGIKAILLDSGRVLNEPATGHWFITPNFFTYVDHRKFRSISKSRIREAFDKAGQYISSQSLILNEEDEYRHFLQYYRIFSDCLPELQLSKDDVQAIANDYVYNYDKYRFFEDVFSVIPKLSKSYKLAVVSDAWPSLENVFRNAGLRDYFSSFIISSKKGITKPNEIMYRSALDELDVSPEETIFIDDNIRNCDGAISLGINSFVLCRSWKTYFYHRMKYRNYCIVRNLDDIAQIFKQPI